MELLLRFEKTVIFFGTPEGTLKAGSSAGFSSAFFEEQYRKGMAEKKTNENMKNTSKRFMGEYHPILIQRTP
jgi:hypothetical protein